MAISLPSDLVLDVAKAVSSTDLRAAKADLVKAASQRSPAADFALAGGEPAKAQAKPDPKTFQKFEAMVLRNFVEAMLPKGTESVYGQGLSGDMWKSMMAEKIADSMAVRGGIGIADRVLGDFYNRGDQKVPVAGVDNGPARAALDQETMLSEALIQQIQRRIVADGNAGESLISGGRL